MTSGPYNSIRIEDFSGGWNPRDAQAELAFNESPDMLNFTLDERGGLVKRLGWEFTSSSISGASAEVQAIFYSKALDRLIVQSGTKLFASTDGGATWGAAIHTFSTSARVDMVDFLGKVVVIHPVDTAFHWDGTTWTGPIANSPKGNTITVWQNYLWSAGDPTPAQKVRVTRSDAGAITWPASPTFVDIRVQDDTPVTCVGGGAGMDTQGRSGMLVFKEASTYRIHDSGTLAYTVVDESYGACSALAVTTNNEVTAAISRRGIITLRGDGEDTPTLVSHKLEPLFSPTNLTYSATDLVAAGNYFDRMVFAIPWDSSASNNLLLEYHPGYGWIVPHNIPAACFTTYTKNTHQLISGHPTATGRTQRLFTTGADNAVAISARCQTRWFEPSNTHECRFRRMLVSGRGAFNVYVKRDYSPGIGDLFQVSLTSTGMLWGTGIWGVGLWGSELIMDYAKFHSLGHGRAIAFEVQESSASSATGQKLLDEGSAPTTGAVAVYGINVDYVPLGAS